MKSYPLQSSRFPDQSRFHERAQSEKKSNKSQSGSLKMDDKNSYSYSKRLFLNLPICDHQSTYDLLTE